MSYRSYLHDMERTEMKIVKRELMAERKAQRDKKRKEKKELAAAIKKQKSEIVSKKEQERRIKKRKERLEKLGIKSDVKRTEHGAIFTLDTSKYKRRKKGGMFSKPFKLSMRIKRIKRKKSKKWYEW